MMATARAAIAALLRADAELAVLLPGGVWERPLQRPDVATPQPGDTPGAFETAGLDAGAVRPCAVVSLFGVGQSFAGTSLIGQLGGRPPVVGRTATINLYERRPGRDAIEAALGRVEDLLDGVQVATDDLGTVVVRYTGNLGDNPGDDDLGAELERANLSITSMRRRR